MGCGVWGVGVGKESSLGRTHVVFTPYNTSSGRDYVTPAMPKWDLSPELWFRLKVFRDRHRKSTPAAGEVHRPATFDWSRQGVYSGTSLIRKRPPP